MEKKYIQFGENCEENAKQAHDFIINQDKDIDSLFESLSKFTICKICTYHGFSHLLKIDVDFNGFSKPKFTFQPVAEIDSIIIFDNADYNSSYVIDVFNKGMEMFNNILQLIIDSAESEEIKLIALQAKQKLNTPSFYYCDNLYLRLLTFNPHITNRQLDFFETQKNCIQPTIMSITKDENSEKIARIINETALGIIDEKKIIALLIEYTKIGKDIIYKYYESMDKSLMEKTDGDGK